MLMKKFSRAEWQRLSINNFFFPFNYSFYYKFAALFLFRYHCMVFAIRRKRRHNSVLWKKQRLKSNFLDEAMIIF